MTHRRLWTIGYDSLSKENLLKVLKGNGIQVVVDLRRWPTSKYEDFRREKMEIWLHEACIEYIWLGKELGGYRSGGYEAFMASKDFKRGIEKLLALIHEKKVCLLCLEKNPNSCHRFFIALYLSRLGFEVIHIDADALFQE
ncbi:MAG: DUF488 domain-containing protein [Candidatus Bathyarchaeia archaeon]